MQCCKKCKKCFNENELNNGLCFDCFEKLQQEKQQPEQRLHFTDNDSIKIQEKNLVASIIKIFAFIEAILSVLFMFLPLENHYSFIITIAGIIIAIFTYAFGEIIQLLEDIKNK